MRSSLTVFVCSLAVACSKGSDAPVRNSAAPPVSAAPSAPGPLAGTVLEALNAANYTYLRLQTAQGEVWAAVPQTATAVGAAVTLENPMVMNGFESKTLGRKFDKILFATLGSGGSAPAQAGSPPAPVAAPPALDQGPIQVAKAEGPEGRTVAEVFLQKAGLKEKSVALRGKVVKFTPGIMGRNWLHVRDGSGSDGTADNDLTVTTQDVAAVGDVVLVKGTVYLDKEFGAGYSYPVMVEGAKLSK